MRTFWRFVLGLLIVGRGTAEAQPHFIDANGVSIRYVDTGSGPAVVLIHGWALDLREWTDQIAALSPHYRVIAFDRRGFGKSGGLVDLSADPGDVRALLDSLGIRSAILMGHSAGAGVAQRFTAAMPDRVNALVLYGGPAPAGFVDRQTSPQLAETQARAAIARRYGIDSVLREVMSLPQFRPGRNRSAAVAARLDSILKDYSGRDLLEDHTPSMAFRPARIEDARAWRMPVLFISGENEARPWQVMSDSLVRWMPDARKVVIPGGGHGVHFDEPQRFNAALLAFLDSVPKTRAAGGRPR
jgi:pimeloyl-ACP methyl ester carboxylesterase